VYRRRYNPRGASSTRRSLSFNLIRHGAHANAVVAGDGDTIDRFGDLRKRSTDGLLRIHGQPPADGALSGCMLMVVLGWERISTVRSDLFTARFTAVNARMRGRRPRTVRGVKRGVVRLPEVLRVFVERHWFVPPGLCVGADWATIAEVVNWATRNA
jgi:hypothetical protein